MPNSNSMVTPDTGGIFQYHEEFVQEVLEFLESYESIYHRPL